MIRDLLLIPVVLTHEVSELLIDWLLPAEELPHPSEVANEHIDAWIDEQYARKTAAPRPWWHR